MRAFQDLGDFAIGASARLDADDVDQYTVAVHGLLRRVGGDIDIARDAFDGALGN
jgi:hypothetical protein